MIVTENRIWKDISAIGSFQVWKRDNSHDNTADPILYLQRYTIDFVNQVYYSAC